MTAYNVSSTMGEPWVTLISFGQPLVGQKWLYFVMYPSPQGGSMSYYPWANTIVTT